MANYTFKYFSGNQQVQAMHYGGKNSEWLRTMKAKRIDSLYRMVGYPLTGPDVILPITRVIQYKKKPSLHKCDARCMNATGHNCECSCGGANHGINAR